MSNAIKTLSIEGFKSIRSLKNFKLRHLNVLIGANGAGKSNFVSFFRLLRELIEQRLKFTVRAIEGGADACLYLGPQITKRFTAKLWFGNNNGYEFALVPTVGNEFAFENEVVVFGAYRQGLGSGNPEAKLKDLKDKPGLSGRPHGVPFHVYEAISSWVVYHFHDTGIFAGVRREGPINDNKVLHPEAQNLAAFLYRIQQTSPDCYNRIRDAVRLAAPFFDDFKLRPVPASPDLIQLEWLQKDSDYPFRAHQLSDGTLRFICLATALLQPVTPATMLFDEPELGLHPYALTLLGDLFSQADSNQIIVSTQSAALLSEFSPEDVIIVERYEGESIFRRLDPSQLSEWLTEYSLGELWQKNVLGGRPRTEDSPQFVPDGDSQ
jgi:predicted ATPase